MTRPAASIAVLAASLLAAAPPAVACGSFFVERTGAKLTQNASQVAVLRRGNRTVMSMSSDYHGPAEDFAMVVPVPVVLHKEDVRTLPANVFDRLDWLSAPRLVHYLEQNPCPRSTRSRSKHPIADLLGGGGLDGTRGVIAEARFSVDEYDIVILSASEATGLATWLAENGYKLPAGADEALAPYVREQSKFFVAKVDVKKVRRDARGVVQLSPLRFSFESNELRLPVRLGLLNSGGQQDLILYVLHPTARFEAANYPNALIPTNLEVGGAVARDFAGFYADLFDATLEHMGGKGLVTEYAWPTSSCDPCPVPRLTAAELAMLGDDIAGGSTPAGQAAVAQTLGDWPVGRNRSEYVLTRLHTRYSRDTLTEDIVLREAAPLVGGGTDAKGRSTGTSPRVRAGGASAFQGRYTIHSHWVEGAACKAPRFGVWDAGEVIEPISATAVAAVERGKVSLRDVVFTPVPSLGLPGRSAAARARAKDGK